MCPVFFGATSRHAQQFLGAGQRLQDSDSAAAGVRVAEHSVAKKSQLAEELMAKEGIWENLGKYVVIFI